MILPAPRSATISSPKIVSVPPLSVSNSSRDSVAAADGHIAAAGEFD